MVIEEIRCIPLLSEMDTTILDKCIAENQLYIKHFSKGSTIHHQHEVCSVLDLVLSGKLVAYSLSENGSAITMFEFHRNSIIGANLLFGDNTNYPLNIYSATNCDVLHISKEAVLEFLHDYHFVMRFIKSLSLNSQGMNRKITMLTQKTLRENLLDYLKQQSIIQSSSTITLPFSKKELADYLGVQRPSLFRELKKMKDEGIIEIVNHTIRLYNLN